jgi:hypothetical protein
MYSHITGMTGRFLEKGAGELELDQILAPGLLVPWSSHGCCGPVVRCLHVKTVDLSEIVRL